MTSKFNTVLSISAFLVAASCLVYLWNDDIILMTDNRRAAEQCMEEAAQGCPLLWDYTSMLEQENKILNLQVQECNALVPSLVPPSE